MGIKTVEWVSNSNVAGKLFDQNTNKVFDPSNYPNEVADIDSKLGGDMALDYDIYENKLWVAADDGYGNLCENILFNGTDKPSVVHVSPTASVDITFNNEGFAIAGVEYTINGQKPVYHFRDGVTSGALTIGSLSSSYNQEQTHEHVYGDLQYDQTNH